MREEGREGKGKGGKITNSKKREKRFKAKEGGKGRFTEIRGNKEDREDFRGIKGDLREEIRFLHRFEEKIKENTVRNQRIANIRFNFAQILNNLQNIINSSALFLHTLIQLFEILK